MKKCLTQIDKINRIQKRKKNVCLSHVVQVWLKMVKESHSNFLATYILINLRTKMSCKSKNVKAARNKGFIQKWTFYVLTKSLGPKTWQIQKQLDWKAYRKNWHRSTWMIDINNTELIVVNLIKRKHFSPLLDTLCQIRIVKS